MKRRNKWLLGIGALVLGAYALWPSNDNLEAKVEQRVQQVQVKERKTRPRFDPQKFCDIINQYQIRKELKKDIIEEKREQPSCLGCEPLTREVKRFKTYKGEVEIVEVCRMLHGDKTEWDLDGNKRAVTPYFCGEKHGTVREWHRNGMKKKECDYEHDKKEGWCREWDDEGHRDIEVHYRNNVKDGMEIGYWFFGDELDHETQWANGKPVGKSRFYTPEGVQYRETVFDDNGRKEEDTYFHRNGRIKSYFLFEDEELIEESFYSDDDRLLIESYFWTAKESPDKTHKLKKIVNYDQNNDILSLLERDINGVVTKRYRADR